MAFWVTIKAFIIRVRHYGCTFLYPLVLTWRIGLIFLLNEYRKKGLNFRRVIIVGSGEVALDLKQELKENSIWL